MRRLMVGILVAGLLFGGVLYAQGKDLSGNWQGTMEGGTGARVLLKISKADAGWKGTWYWVDGMDPPIPVAPIGLQGTAINFSIKLPELNYAGTLSAGGDAIEGIATINGKSHGLNLKRVSNDDAWTIREAPKPMAADVQPKFEVVTVKPSDPNRKDTYGFDFRGRHMRTFATNVNDLIAFAYGLHAKQILGGPEWLGTERFDIDGVPDVDGQANLKQMKMLIQSVLMDRFKLVFHHEKKELAVYALATGKSGPKLTKTAHQPSDASAFYFRGLGNLTVVNLTMAEFCVGMQGSVMDRPVVDHTGLTDRYDFFLKWTPDESQFIATGARVPPPTDDPNAPPGLYTAIREQLGLELQAEKSPADVMVIDHVEQPTAN